MTSPSTSVVLHLSRLEDPWLKPWEEVTGRLIRLEDNGDKLEVELSSVSLTFDSNSDEAAEVKGKLNEFEGDIVSVLRTDSDGTIIKIAGEFDGE